MSSTPAPIARSPRRTRRVGVRELRQNLSVYLDRVAAGEALEVTDHGRAVAMLIPLKPAATVAEKLVASGRALPPTRDPASVGPTRLRMSAAERRRVWAAWEETRQDRV